ncbi:hypothetical protein BU15DRAFT_85633 [Melanogaster broomeanus]|nr:hypothetical protein BU15DRAFT_85633 [Melanogaster broomeanus]
MSAVRRNDRRANRNNFSSPYTRHSKSSRVPSRNKSPWSLSGLISFLNPFTGRGESDSNGSDLSEASDGEIEQGSPPRPVTPPQPAPPPPLPPQQQVLPIPQIPPVVNGQAASSRHAPQTPRNQLPFSLNTPSQVASSSSLVKNLEPVTRFLAEKAGQPLNEFEAAGIVDYIQKNVQGSAFVPDKPEPFRFSTSPSRGSSPNLSLDSSNNDDAQTSRKTLSRNPNGVYRWQGAGSSRPRNRYQSPGFSPRPRQNRIKLSPPKTPLTTDTKRRRVGDEAESSKPHKAAVPSTSTISFPVSVSESPVQVLQRPSTPPAMAPNGKAPAATTLTPAPPVMSKTNGTQPRLRTAGVTMKPTAPVIPSPLRQAWKQSDSPPQVSLPSRPTRAANFMTELIKEVTPTKKTDVSNPYQTASPIKPPAPPSAKPVEKPKEKEPEVSAQAIIEATVPKVAVLLSSQAAYLLMYTSRRGANAPDLYQNWRRQPMWRKCRTTDLRLLQLKVSLNLLASVAQPRPLSYHEAITVREEEERPSKMRKTPPPLHPPVQVQQVECVDASVTYTRPAEIIEPNDDIKINGSPSAPVPVVKLSPPPSTSNSPLRGVKAAVPKEPSKLRYSYQADKVEVKAADTTPAPSLASLFTPPPIAFPSTPILAPVPPKAKLAPKDEVLAMDVDELPKYSFSTTTTTSPAGPSSLAARDAVLSMSVSFLPTYEFKPVAAPVRAMDGFNWTAAGLKAPTTAGGEWKCKLCNLENPVSATEKCTICDAPRPVSTPSSIPPAPTIAAAAPAPSAPVQAFDWTKAGLAPPPKPQSGTWTCTSCTLSNPASATDKCTICDARR